LRERFIARDISLYAEVIHFRIIRTVLREPPLVRKKIVDELHKPFLPVPEPLFCEEYLAARKIGRRWQR
jgi:hypothetical protein